MYVWVIDAYLNNEFVDKISQFLTLFLKTFPIIPICISLLILIMFVNYKKNLSVVKLEFFTLLIYTLALAFYGYYSRRLTFPIIIFVLLMILKMYMKHPKKISTLKFSLTSRVLVFITLSSWLFTNGPLM
jgi:hypothetical protein